ncbi:hypothetical protein DOTSEDRAFT_32394 [Dothistroma septosporum NZE10]|uniref:Uncharacterized protein n=1 Tax=Dothistroma septosporum (strain NZE10 / CBS 128990) TaxID=675120 RepID=N1PXC2_DOTSN|nr:hypothetical protein DOTSEDRAFT_32394 [Dothistroma septosporum NZE10]
MKHNEQEVPPKRERTEPPSVESETGETSRSKQISPLTHPAAHKRAKLTGERPTTTLSLYSVQFPDQDMSREEYEKCPTQIRERFAEIYQLRAAGFDDKELSPICERLQHWSKVQEWCPINKPTVLVGTTGRANHP